MTKNAQNTETPVKSEETLTIGAMTAEQLAEAQAELQALSESLEDKEKALLEKEQALDSRISEVNQKEADLEEQYQHLKNELETKVEELRAEKEALLEKEQELTAKEEKLKENETELKELESLIDRSLDNVMEDGEVSLEQFLRENAHPDGIQYSEYVLKVTNGPESHLEGYIKPNPYGGQTKSVKITATLVKVS